ncbi:MAG: hypothetical protein ACRDDX_15815 [Cellulosilyticaceae bacterium]
MNRVMRWCTAGVMGMMMLTGCSEKALFKEPLDVTMIDKIQVIEAKGTLDDTLGVTMPELDYASEDRVIFHGYFGLFIYDLQREEIVQSLDLESIGCQWAQGSNYCEIEVSEDGNVITLHPMESEEMYRYTVDTQILEKLPHTPMETPFQVVLNEQPNGAVSFGVVAFEDGEIGYLEAQGDTLDGLYYKRGEKQYKLFKE